MINSAVKNEKEGGKFKIQNVTILYKNSYRVHLLVGRALL